MWIRIGAGEHEGAASLVEGPRFVIGSGDDAQMRLAGEGIAARHAAFTTLDDGRVELQALEGQTFVDGEPLSGWVAIKGDEKIRIGETLLVLSPGEPATAAGQEEVERAAVESLEAIAHEADPDSLAEPHTLPPDDSVPLRARRVQSTRAALEGVRRLRRATRRALAAAAAAVLLALAALILTLTGAIGGGDEGPEVADIVDAAEPGTVLVSATAEDAEGESLGTGFVIDAKEGLVATNFHVVNGGTEFDVEASGGGREATLLAAAPCEDLAVLKLEDTDGLEALPLGDQASLEEGEPVVAVGFPGNATTEEELSSTAGVVSIAQTKLEPAGPEFPFYENVIQTDAALNPGNSGGPLLGDDKEVVGVNTVIGIGADGSPAQGQGYAIGIDRAKEVLGDLRAGRSRSWFGAGIFSPTPEEKEAGASGIVATLAVPGTASEEAGFAGGVVTSVDGERVDGSLVSYCDATEDLKSGDDAELAIASKPGGKPENVTITFE